MQENILPKNFLNDNPLNEMSSAQISYFQMITITNSEFSDKFTDAVMAMMGSAMQKDYEEDQRYIRGIDNAEDLVKYMRKSKSVQNRSIIVEKALSIQEDVMPLILKRFMTSGQDVFIEIAAIILANADMKYVDQLHDAFKEIRHPYARSKASIVLGIKGIADSTPLLLEQYRKIKQERPDKDYEQGPLMALHLIHGE